MIITFSLIADQVDTNISVDGDTITIEDVKYDFSDLLDGETRQIETETWPFLGPVSRHDGQIFCKIIYHYNVHTAMQENPELLEAQTQEVASGKPRDPVRRDN